MADAKASGPLWTVAYNESGAIVDSDGVYQEKSDAENTASWLNTGPNVVNFASAVPCRILPGHGRYVPAELVEAIDAALNEDYCHIDERLNAVKAAIRAAKEGAV